MAGKFKRKTTTYNFNVKNDKGEWLDSYGETGQWVANFLSILLTVMKLNGKRLIPKNYKLYEKVVNHLTSLNVTVESIKPITKHESEYFTKDIQKHGLTKAYVVLVVKDGSVEIDMDYQEVNKKVKEILFAEGK